ncbi:MAG: S-layer family protein, partial [Hydrococcus sp. RU_2_2]|nr:S-layer family protein [Hydrococcus sp. RU_2_2]
MLSGGGGNIALTSEAAVFLAGSRLSSTTNGSRDSGDIQIDAKAVFLSNGAQIDTSTSGRGNAGNISMQADEMVSLSNSKISSEVFLGEGNSGNIKIEASSLSLTDGAEINAGTDGLSKAGNIFVKVKHLVSLSNSQISSEVFLGEGDGGIIDIETGSLFLTNGSELSVFTLGKGDAGDINIYARNTVSLANSFISGGVTIFGEGNGGDINIKTGSLILTNNARVGSQTQGQGDAGDIFIKAGDFVSLDNSLIRSDVDSAILGTEGDGGQINIETGSLLLTNNALLSASTDGQGNAGNIFVKADDSVLLDNSFIASNVGLQLFGAKGNAGNINIETGLLSLANFSIVSSATLGQGNAGNIFVKADDSVNLYGVNPDGVPGGILTSTEQGAILQGDDNVIFVPSRGRGGDLTVNTPTLRISDGNVLSARTKNAFDGGEIVVNVNTLELTGGGQILTSSFINRGNAGSVTVNATNTISLSGTDPTFFERRDRFLDVLNDGPASGLFARTLGAGKAGDLTITAGQLIVWDGASVAVGSQGTGKGGNIQIQANSLALDNKASISAETFSTDGGNIILQVQDLLLLRNDSEISTNAGTERAGGNGGNIDINSQFIIAVPIEDSNIEANAFKGRGGNINIDAQGIFGIEFREEPTNLSDITASSEFGIAGNVQIDAPDTDPSRRVVNLPTLTVEAEIVQACNPSDTQQSEFVITGRGGLPP